MAARIRFICVTRGLFDVDCKGGMLRIASKPFVPNFLYSSARFGYERPVPAMFEAMDCLMMPLSPFELRSLPLKVWRIS